MVSLKSLQAESFDLSRLKSPPSCSESRLSALKLETRPDLFDS